MRGNNVGARTTAVIAALVISKLSVGPGGASTAEAHPMQATLRDAVSVLEGQFSRQGAELVDAHDLDTALRAAQAVLEARLADQTEQLRQSRASGRTNQANS